MDDLNTDADGTTDQTGLDQTVADGTDQTTTEPSAETFLNDAELLAKIRGNPELDHVFKKMQGAYTKRSQGLARVRDAASIVERFNSDPDFARQTIMQRAQQLGLNVGQPGQQPGFQNGSASKSVPPELIEAYKSNLSPELQWMASTLAAAQHAGMQMALKPLEQQQALSSRNTRDQEYDSMATSLSEKAPGWESHEEDMTSLLTFLQAPTMHDRRWGNKLELLYKLTAGDGQATAEAARRMGQAVKSRAPAGSPMASPTPNIAEQIKKPKNSQDAWQIAANHAIAEMARQGIKVS